MFAYHPRRIRWQKIPKQVHFDIILVSHLYSNTCFFLSNNLFLNFSAPFLVNLMKWNNFPQERVFRPRGGNWSAVVRKKKFYTLLSVSSLRLVWPVIFFWVKNHLNSFAPHLKISLKNKAINILFRKIKDWLQKKNSSWIFRRLWILTSFYAVFKHFIAFFSGWPPRWTSSSFKFGLRSFEADFKSPT